MPDGQTRGINVAVTAWSAGTGWRADALCRQAETAEAMGFHSFWLPENHFGDQRSVPAPLTLLAAVAARTSRIRLGSTSYLLPIRHPLLAAEEVAVLDQLSNGRVILGMGRGMSGPVFDAFGISASDKRKLFQANLEIMCSAWRGDPIAGSKQGKPVVLAPLPVQRPHPPLWVAAFGPLALKQVARLGLPYLASPVESLATLEQNYQHYRLALKAAKKNPVSTVPVMRTIFISERRESANAVRARLESSLPPAMRREGVAVEDWAIVGDRSYVSDKLQEYIGRLGINHLIARGGLPGVDGNAQLKSHQLLLDIIAGF
ncbi:MAG: LLM class flavin-dependent oxidoreductase [Pseudomonadales bacterium]|nr:LLM class flavin-dependent oxidoreductase [Pseudomonadales bacterium]